MKIEYINPFIEATEATFQRMCGTTVERDGKLSIRASGSTTYELIGTIGLSGAVKGAVLMTMDMAVGRKIVKKFLGDSTITDQDLMDGFGEILNIISGAAAAKLGRVDLSLPTVIIGKDQKIHSLQMSPWVVIPLLLKDMGKFNIEVALEEEKQ